LGHVPDDSSSSTRPPDPRPDWFSRRPPLWLRWALSLSVGAALILGLVLFVDHNNSDALAPESPAAEVRVNREDEIIVAQDQAPHGARVRSGTAPLAAIERAVRAETAQAIAKGQLDGPLQRTRCTPTGSSTATRRTFRCTVTASNVNYQFDGVVDIQARQLTYCKRDAPPVPSQNIPVSPRCLG
jgi:hypothetical protein